MATVQRESISFEIIEKGGKLGKTSSKGWTKELNKVKWGDNEPKWEVRDWNEDHTKCGKGATFDDNELNTLRELLNKQQNI